MKMLKALLPTAAAVVFAVGVSHADFFYRWSQTAGNNANSDTFTWAEGQAPSTVNDSARGMMAALAKWRDDTSGKLVTAGTATAYTLTTNQVFNTLAAMDGALLSFRMNVTSGAAATLNVDGLGAKALNQATGVAIATGALVSGAVYEAVYVNASNEWIVRGIAGVIPSGTTMLSMTACPTGWTTSATANDRALVISSSTAGTTAGATAFSTYFSGSSTIGAHTLTKAEIPTHIHALTGTTTGSVDLTHAHGITIATLSGAVAAGGGANGVIAVATSTDNSGALSHSHSLVGALTLNGTADGVLGGAHDHTIPAVQSVTVVGCTKN